MAKVTKKTKDAKPKEKKTKKKDLEVTSFHVLEEEPKPKKKKRIKVSLIFLVSLLVLGIGIASTVLAFGLYIVFTAPEFTVTRLYNKESSAIYDKNGTLITRIGEEDRVLKTYDEFPQVLIDALVATEDSRFFQHNGFDAGRFLKASLGQAAGNSDAGGASTITMQLVKQNFTSDEASGIEGIIRKFTDIYMAVFKIEKNYTKQEIIEFYFNSMWLAGGGTNYESINGVEQASQYYFGKSVSDITLSEAAILVGMYNNPSLFNPYVHPDNAAERRSTVLSLMVKHGYITEQEKIDAENIPVESLLRKDIATQNTAGPYQNLIEFVTQDIKDKLGINIYEGGYAVQTTFDLKTQDIVNNVQNGAAWQFSNDKVQVGIAVTSTKDGSIVALGSGRNYAPGGTERATSIKRQPGSTAKPLFDYGPLIEYNNASPQQMILDYPYSYNTGQGINNWDNGYFGVIDLKYALSSSRNIPALEVFQQVDKKNIAEFVNNLGIDYTADQITEAYSIGGMPDGLTPLEASAAYAAFGRGGYYIEPYSFTSITNLETEETIEWKYEKKRAMSEETAYLITDMLLQATASGVGGNINSNLRKSVASKSGTSNIDDIGAKENNVSIYATPDHWVNTYSPDYSISLWMGYDILDKDHYFTSGTGGTPRTLMSAYLANHLYHPESSFTKPSGITTVTIESQLLPPKKAGKNTPSNMKVSAMFKAGTEPSETSTRFDTLDTPANVKANASNGKITVSWDAIGTPDAFNETKVKQDFENAHKAFKSQYSSSYEKYLNRYLSIYNSYNSSSLGTVGYIVTVTTPDGKTKDLGWTKDTSITYTPTMNGEYEFHVKSSLSIFRDNQSPYVDVTETISNLQDEPNTSEGLKVTANTYCLLKGATFDPKKALKVTYDGKDVTNDTTVTFTTFDNTKDGDYSVTYNVIYNKEKTTVEGKVSVKAMCSN